MATRFRSPMMAPRCRMGSTRTRATICLTNDWPWAGTETEGLEPDVVMACAGDVPTLETLAAVDLLRKALPELKIRVVNVVDLMTL